MPGLRHGLLRSVEVATISSGTALSDEIVCEGKRLAGIVMPAAWTAADLTFQGSVDGSRFVDIHDDSGTEETVTADADRYIPVNPALWEGVQRIKVRSGTSAAPVNQAADRSIQLVLVD